MLTLKTRVMWPQSNDCWQPPEARRDGMDSSPEPMEAAQACQHLDFGPVILSLDFWPLELRENTLLLF